MQVYKLIWKIIKAKKSVVLMYSCIFLAVFIAFTTIYKSEDQVEGFKSTESVFAIKDMDQSALSTSFVDYISDHAEVLDIDVSTDEKVKDAIFYNEIAYYIEIPQGFEASFTTDSPSSLITKNRVDSKYNMLSEQLIDGYLQNVRMYKLANPERTMSDIDQQIRNNENIDVPIHFANEQQEDGEINGLSMYFNYMLYIFNACFIMIGGTILLTINDTEIRKRNLLSPISQTSFQAQLALGCSGFALIYWMLFMGVVQLLLGNLFTSEGIYFMLNSLIMLFVTMGLTFMIGMILAGKKNMDEALNACSNVIGLGSSFLCGVFIPQALLGESVKIFSSFLPGFWYIKANEMIGAMALNGLDTTELLNCFGIQALFGVVFFLLAMWISKTKMSTKEFA